MAKEKVITKPPVPDTTGDLKFIGDLAKKYASMGVKIDNAPVVCEFINTSNYALNYILSGDFRHGIPEGQTTEIHGDSSTGKSLLLYNIIAEFQAKYKDGWAILDDAEFAYVEYLGSKLQIDKSRLIHFNSFTVEGHNALVFNGGTIPMPGEEPDQVVDQPLVDYLLKKGVKHILVALDSIAVLSTRHELKVGLEKPNMDKAKIVKALMRVIQPVVTRNNITYVITNHLIAAMNSPIPGMKVTPGGGGVVFQASVRLCLSLAGKLKVKDSNVVLGVRSWAQTIKNRFAPPLRSCPIEIYYGSGISRYSGLIDLLKSLGAVENAPGGWFAVKGTSFKFQSKDIEKKWPEIYKLVTDGGLLNVRDQDAEFSKDMGPQLDEVEQNLE